MSAIHITPPPLSPQAMADLLCTIIVLCRGTGTDGKPFWAYMCVKPSMAEAFKSAREQGSFQLEEYGTVLAMGEGDDVPPDVMARMEREYSVNHRYEDELLNYIKAMTKAE